MLSSAVQRSYQPRYEYRGVISGPRYIINKAKKVDPNAQLNEGQSKNHSILLAYSGAKYVGYQRQPWKGAINTIEQELLSAMLKSNWITDSHYWKPHKVRMEKASRTDSGVSASRQIVSVLMCKRHIVQVKQTYERRIHLLLRQFQQKRPLLMLRLLIPFFLLTFE